jgi:hypothetical protein
MSLKRRSFLRAFDRDWNQIDNLVMADPDGVVWQHYRSALRHALANTLPESFPDYAEWMKVVLITWEVLYE